MIFRFENRITEENGVKQIEIPFNVWEVCEQTGVVPVEVCVDGKTYICDLVSHGKGNFSIPVPKEVEALLSGKEMHSISFQMTEYKVRVNHNSPYSRLNPIRKIDSIELVRQPHDGLCGQACIAMLAGITLDEAINVMHCSEWQGTVGKVIETLDYLGISYVDEIIYTNGKTVELPKCCLIMERMGRYNHYLVYFDGVYYDSVDGIINDYDTSEIVGYLEVR